MFKKPVLVATALLFFALGSCAHAPLQDFQNLSTALVAADGGPDPLTFQPGKSFLDPPGRIIFLSRERGIRRLIALARAGEPELAMLYLPKRGAWLTITKQREMDFVREDSRYVEAAMLIEDVVEMWHTHNDVNLDPASTEPHQQLSMKWTMPSGLDLQQIYDYSREIPGSQIRGNIAHIYGVTEYWNDNPNWAQVQYIRFALVSEAKHMQDAAAGLRVRDLETFSQGPDGIMKLKVTLRP